VIRISYHPSLSGTTPVAWPESVAIARDAGFPAMDVVLHEIADRPADEVRDRLAEMGVSAGPASLPVEFRLDEKRFREDLARLPGQARLAAATGVRTMFRSIPASSERPAVELVPTLRRRINAIAAILGEHDIDLAVETLGPLHRRREGPHEIIWRLPDAAEFVTSCGPEVGLLVDSWHWHHAEGTAAEIVALGTMIRHVHVADAPDLPPEQIRDEQRLPPGEGIVDHVGFFRALQAAGYDRFISPEVRGYSCGQDPTPCARAALAAVRKAQGEGSAHEG
jgi:sugar phosphate isomerase/epimerase